MSQELNYLFDLLKLKYGREALSKIFTNLLNEKINERRTDKAANHKARREKGHK